jgi:hypothetical protein
MLSESALASNTAQFVVSMAVLLDCKARKTGRTLPHNYLHSWVNPTSLARKTRHYFGIGTLSQNVINNLNRVRTGFSKNGTWNAPMINRGLRRRFIGWRKKPYCVLTEPYACPSPRGLHHEIRGLRRHQEREQPICDLAGSRTRPNHGGIQNSPTEL